VSKHHNWRRVDSEIKTLIDEAKAILKSSNFPTSFTELQESKKKHHDRLTLEAELVVLAEYYLQQAVENNKADEAALRMLDLYVAYSRMTDLRDIPESAEWSKVVGDEREAYIKIYKAGFKNLSKNKNRENAITFDKQIAIRKRAIQLRNEKPDFCIYQIEDILAKEFNVSESTLQKIKHLVPKRTSKKKK
jgi:hypothetical protein